jgi:AraC-like DNA-binding protein
MRQNIKITGYAENFHGGFLVDWHQHREDQVAHASQGVMRIYAAGGVWIVPPGRALWIPRLVSHAIDCRGSLHMRTIYLAGKPPFPGKPITVWQISSLMRELIMRFSDGTAVANRGAMTELLLTEMRRCRPLDLRLPMPADKKLNQLCQSLLQDPGERRMMDHAARSLVLSPRTFTRRFRESTGMNFRQWRMQARLKRSTETLEQGHSVSQAAYEAGYESVSAFTSAFRSVFGETPSRFTARK